MAANRPDSRAGSPRIAGLADLLEAQAQAGTAPVDAWEPSRTDDIGMAIGADGTWSYQGSPIGRPALVKLFARVLRRDADGRHYLVTPVEKIVVDVADAPFLAVEMQIEGHGRGQTLILRTNVDDVVRVNAEHPLRFATEAGSGGLKPYVTVRGRLEALVTRALYYDMVALAEPIEEGSEALGLWSGGVCFALENRGPKAC